MMKNIVLLIVAFFICIPPVDGAALKCSTCGKKRKKFLLTLQTARFCSKACVPEDKKCTNCAGLLIGRFTKVTYGSNYGYYCMKCADAPRCSSCHLPIPQNDQKSIAGEIFCQKCAETLLTPAKASSLMRKIRQELKKAYGYDTAHQISLKLMDYKSITKLGNRHTVGLMKYELKRNETDKKDKDSKKAPKWQMKCEIYLLDTLSVNNAGQVLAHELTHDYLFHHLGRTSNQAVCEGICEAIAAEWLLSKGKVADYEAKKQNPDPIYGEGFRLIYPQLKRRGFKKMLEDNRHYFKPVIR